MTLPLAGRTAVVTGVSRMRGIGFAIACRLAEAGANLFLQHFAAHDRDQPWGADDVEDVMGAVRDRLVAGARLEHRDLDLADATAPTELVDMAVAEFDHLDVLVCNHARSGGDGRLTDLTPQMLDGHWQVNTRSTLLATAAFAVQHDGRPGGRVVWLTSGQELGPMPDEVAYATSKAALAGVTASVADDLVERGIVLNTVNPGPVNTGYLDPVSADRPLAVLEKVQAHFPGGRAGEPDDPARLIAWLVTDDARWVVGQVISAEGGFRRW